MNTNKIQDMSLNFYQSHNTSTSLHNIFSHWTFLKQGLWRPSHPHIMT